MRFTVNVSGQVTSVRFFKLAANTAQHTGSLWTGSGTLLATVSFTNETASEWQQANFGTPINILANSPYVISYHTTGHYAVNSNYFPLAIVAGPIAVPGAGANGLYSYGAATTFPTLVYQDDNYWVDLVFKPTAPLPCPTFLKWQAKEATYILGSCPSAVQLQAWITANPPTSD